MNAITITNLTDEESRKLEALAATNGTTAEAEAERLLGDALSALTGADEAALPADTSGRAFFAALQQLGREYPELQEIDFSRDQTPARGADFT